MSDTQVTFRWLRALESKNVYYLSLLTAGAGILLLFFGPTSEPATKQTATFTAAAIFHPTERNYGIQCTAINRYNFELSRKTTLDLELFDRAADLQSRRPFQKFENIDTSKVTLLVGGATKNLLELDSPGVVFDTARPMHRSLSLAFEPLSDEEKNKTVALKFLDFPELTIQAGAPSAAMPAVNWSNVSLILLAIGIGGSLFYLKDHPEDMAFWDSVFSTHKPVQQQSAVQQSEPSPMLQKEQEHYQRRDADLRAAIREKYVHPIRERMAAAQTKLDMEREVRNSGLPAKQQEEILAELYQLDSKNTKRSIFKD